MKHKRLFALFIAMMMVLSTLVGCGGTGGKETTEAPGTEAPDNDTTANSVDDPTDEEPTSDYSMYKVEEPIKILFWHALKKNDAFWEGMVEEFNKLSAETNVTVEAISVGTMDNCKDQLNAAHQARQGVPAVVTINYPATPKYFENGIITDISELMAANGFDFNDLIDGVVDQVTVGDSIIGMPWGCTATVYFYNRTVLAQHNLDTFPTTWEEFNDPTKTAFDNENLIARMKELKELVSAGYVDWNIEGGDLIATKWLNGDTMCLNISSEYYQNYLENMEAVSAEEQFEIGLAWTFGETHDYATVGGNVLCVAEEISQEEKNAAAVFLNWLNTPQNHAKWATYTNNCMIHKENINNSALIDELYAELPETKTAIYPYLEEHYKMKPQTEHYDPVNDEMMIAVQEIFCGDADFDTRWKAALEEVEYILAGN